MHRLGLRVSYPSSLLLYGVRWVYLALAQDYLETFVAGEQLTQNHALLALGLVRSLDLLKPTVDRHRWVRTLLGFLSYLVLFENTSCILSISHL